MNNKNKSCLLLNIDDESLVFISTFCFVITVINGENLTLSFCLSILINDHKTKSVYGHSTDLSMLLNNFHIYFLFCIRKYQ